MLNIIGLLIVGIIIGLLARAILPGRQKLGLVATMVLGVLGALIGGLIASQIGSGDIFELNVLGFIVAVLSAAGLLAIGERMGIGAGPKRGHLAR